MFQLLRQPYPLSESPAARWRISVLFGIFVSLFLLVFQPFGFDQIPSRKLLHAINYGLVCFGIMVVTNIIVVRLFPRYFLENSWTTGKQIVLTMFTIGLIGWGNALYTSYAFGLKLPGKSILHFELITLAIGIFPVSASYIFNQLLLQRRYQTGAIQLNQQFKPRALSEERLVLRGENQDEELQLSSQELYYLQAAENYVEIHYLLDKEHKKILMRGSMRSFESQLAAQDHFLRCHKSFIVNKNRVVGFSGNAQGYRLQLLHLDAEIPVSRSLNSQIKSLFTP
ncbi:MAG: LytR/AlgR family response regulator transcription factor [Bacteroidia bacterium]